MLVEHVAKKLYYKQHANKESSAERLTGVAGFLWIARGVIRASGDAG